MLKSLQGRLNGSCFCAVGQGWDEEPMEWAQSQAGKIDFSHSSLFQLQFKHQH